MAKHKYTPEQQIASFWNKVNKDGSIPDHCPELGQCWEWIAHCDKYGYGTKSWNEKQDKAHRVSWIIAHGEIPNNLWVLHKCDNPKCVRPDHLILGTPQQNTDDRERKGRSKFIQNPISDLTRQRVDEIRLRYALGGTSQAILATEYGLNTAAIWFIVNFKDW